MHHTGGCFFCLFFCIFKVCFSVHQVTYSIVIDGSPFVLKRHVVQLLLLSMRKTVLGMSSYLCFSPIFLFNSVISSNFTTFFGSLASPVTEKLPVIAKCYRLHMLSFMCYQCVGLSPSLMVSIKRYHICYLRLSQNNGTRNRLFGGNHLNLTIYYFTITKRM